MSKVTHKSYCSIENISNAKFIQSLKLAQQTGGEWIVTEKIHGANFCLIVTADGSIACSRRKALLSEEEFFYNWKELRNKYSKDAQHVFQELTKNMDDEEREKAEVRIYAELYGGFYPGLGTEGDCIRVQKALYYAPYNDIIVFDIKCGSEFIDFHHMREVCSITSLRTTDPLAQGSFDEVINYDPHFVTKLPELLGFEPVEDNICEGVVIKPNKTQYLQRKGGTRVIIKKKNERFAEITGSKAKPKKCGFTVTKKGSEELDKALTELQRYFNENRLDAVVSKIGSVTLDQSNKLRGMLAQDALKDFAKMYEDYEKLKPKDIALLGKAAPQLASPVVLKYFENS